MPGVLAIHAHKCQGNSLTLTILPPTLRPVEVGIELVALPGEKFSLALNNLYQAPSFDAAVPPPDAAVL